MCTAISYKTKDCYFGRNLDWHHSYGEKFVITPKRYPLKFKYLECTDSHYAIFGTAIVENGFPLYFEAANEVGICCASLNFPENAKYFSFDKNIKNVTSYEFIPWILCQCKCINEVKNLLKDTIICNDSFSDEYQPSPLHWMISDGISSITVESVNDGIKIYDNLYGVLTNNPTFDFQIFNLDNYICLSTQNYMGDFANKASLTHYGNGMGAIGLPGDLSSVSRFVRAVFTKINSISAEDEYSSVNQFFHILDNVSQKKGCNKVGNDEYEYTIYSTCYNTNKNIYYYKTYENNQISMIDIRNETIEGKELISYPFIRSQNIYKQN